MDKNKLLLAKISDKIKQYKKTGEPTHTSFLDPAEQMEAESILRDIPHFAFGGYDDAERKVMIIGDVGVGALDDPQNGINKCNTTMNAHTCRGRRPRRPTKWHKQM